MRSEKEIRELIIDLKGQIKQCNNFDDILKGKYFIQTLEWILDDSEANNDRN